MRFSIRDLLLVTVIVALAVGWAIDHWQSSPNKRKLKELETMLERGGWEISWDPSGKTLIKREEIEGPIINAKEFSDFRRQFDRMWESSAPDPNRPKN